MKNCHVIADEKLLVQVIENFLSNVVRYTPPEGRLTVMLSRTEETMTFRGEKSGSHFSKEEKIRNTFYKTDDSRNSKGTGLCGKYRWWSSFRYALMI